MDYRHAVQLVTHLAVATKGQRLYPAGHPALSRPLQDLLAGLEGLLESRNEVSLGLVDETLFCEGHLLLTAPVNVQELAERLTVLGIGAISFSPGVRLGELSSLANLLARSEHDASGMAVLLREQGGDHISIHPREGAVEPTGTAGEQVLLGTYHQALDAIDTIFSDIENDQPPNGERIVKVVSKLVDLSIRDPSTLLGLSMIKDYDRYTYHHSVNVGVLAISLGASMGFSRHEMEEVGSAGFLHDIGKTVVEKTILNKPGKLSAAEFEQMKLHPETGARIIGEMGRMTPQVTQAVLGHHIRHNREGYPEWARKLPFNVMSEIVAIGDCYDAITSLRAYKRPLTPKAALDEIGRLAGNYLDSQLVSRFIELLGEYPVGSLVRLDTNEIAIVLRRGVDGGKPLVRVIFDHEGHRLTEGRPQLLTDAAGNRYADIVAVVDPLLKNIDVGREFRALSERGEISAASSG